MIKFENVNVTIQGKKNSVRYKSGDTGWGVRIDMRGKWMWKNHNDKTD